MSVAAIVAVAANAEGRREVVGLHIGPSEAETFWASFLKSLVKRGLQGVKLVISDAHEGLNAAIVWHDTKDGRCATRADGRSGSTGGERSPAVG